MAQAISQKTFDNNIKELKLLVRNATDTQAKIRANNFLLDTKLKNFNQKNFESIVMQLKKSQPSATKRTPVKVASKKVENKKLEHAKNKKVDNKKVDNKKVASKKSSDDTTEQSKFEPKEVKEFTYLGYKITPGADIWIVDEKGKEVKRKVTKIVQVRPRMARIYFDLPSKLKDKFSDYVLTHTSEILEIPETDDVRIYNAEKENRKIESEKNKKVESKKDKKVESKKDKKVESKKRTPVKTKK